MNAIVRAVRDIIASMPSPSFPVSTLHADVSAGATTFQVAQSLDAAGNSRIVENSWLTFYDATGEPAICQAGAPVTAGGLTTVTMKTSTIPLITGLQFAHTVNTPVYANIYTHFLYDGSGPLNLGDPVFVVLPPGQTDSRTLQPSAGFPSFALQVACIYRLDRSDKSVDPELWSRYVTERAETDMDAIAARLEAHQDLVTDFWPSPALIFGGDGQAQIGRRSPRLIKEDAIWHFVATLDLTILGVGQPMY